MAIHNQIFHAYRDKKQKIEKAKELLNKNNYIVISKEDFSKIKNHE
jgi:hypothetical protein|tara:strand:- start:289 stop:426 length:138 start_codon:yes stop_codon:yes gene_type:complete